MQVIREISTTTQTCKGNVYYFQLIQKNVVNGKVIVTIIISIFLTILYDIKVQMCRCKIPLHDMLNIKQHENLVINPFPISY